LFMCAYSLFFFLSFFFLHWLELQVNGLQMVAAAAVAIFNTPGWPQPLLTLESKRVQDLVISLSSGAQHNNDRHTL
jgi:hypothetical protein